MNIAATTVPRHVQLPGARQHAAQERRRAARVMRKSRPGRERGRAVAVGGHTVPENPASTPPATEAMNRARVGSTPRSAPRRGVLADRVHPQPHARPLEHEVERERQGQHQRGTRTGTGPIYPWPRKKKSGWS